MMQTYNGVFECASYVQVFFEFYVFSDIFMTEFFVALLIINELEGNKLLGKFTMGQNWKG
jgi:hypothetical protein